MGANYLLNGMILQAGGISLPFFHEETNATSNHHFLEQCKFFQDFVAICSYSGSMLGIVAIFYVQLHASCPS